MPTDCSEVKRPRLVKSPTGRGRKRQGIEDEKERNKEELRDKTKEREAFFLDSLTLEGGTDM